MSEFNATSKDVSSAEKIRRQYVSREADKMEQLKKLDDKVKLPGKIAGSLVGVIGALTMGGGMSLVMVWGNMQTGLLLGILGMVVALLAYPLYNIITSRRKKKYVSEINHLSDAVIGGSANKYK